MAGMKGFEPLHGGFRVHSLTAWLHPNGLLLYSTLSPINVKQKFSKEKSANCGQTVFMAGMKGFEPLHGGFRVHSLTAWLHPNE